MIGKVIFETDTGEIRPQQDYGILLKTYEVSPPKVKIYRVQLDGADGAVDFTEWTGGVLYETRTVTVQLRDMNNRRSDIRQRLLGRNAKITFSDDPDWYYYGRCDEIQETTHRHVTDMTIVFTCQPYKLAHRQTIITDEVSTTKTFKLHARRMAVFPVINVDGSATVKVGGVDYPLVSGDNSNPAWKLTETDKSFKVTGAVTVKFIWRDGEL